MLKGKTGDIVKTFPWLYVTFFTFLKTVGTLKHRKSALGQCVTDHTNTHKITNSGYVRFSKF